MHKKIETPEKLLELFEEYVKSVEPTKMNVIHPKLGIVELTNESPITMEGFKAWGHREKNITIRHYISNTEKKYDEFMPIVEYIKDFIFNRNFSGAACGKYKEALIIRQLQLKENIDTNSTIVAQITGMEIK